MQQVYGRAVMQSLIQRFALVVENVKEAAQQEVFQY